MAPPGPLCTGNGGAGLVENGVDLLEAAAGGLGVEEPDERYEGEVEDGEDEVALPALGGHGAGGHHDGGEVPEPVGRGGDGIALAAQVQGHDLGAVQPGDGEKADGEEGVVKEEGNDDDDGGAEGARTDA